MSTSKISLYLAASRKPTAGVKRSHARLLDDEDDGNAELGRAQRVSHFDQTAGGAIDQNAPKAEFKPLVIQSQANRDWKEAAHMRKRQKSELPGAHGRNRQDPSSMQNANDLRSAQEPQQKSLPKFGLNIASAARDTDAGESSKDGETAAQAQKSPHEDDEQPATRPKTDDEVAMDALLGRSHANQTLVLPTQPSLSESDAFRHDYASAPDMSTLEDYARVPVEQFGAALLRGMGWKEGEGIGSQRGKKIDPGSAKVPERRAALLGIGAKEDATAAREMGAWGKAAKGSKEVKIYNPVLLRDKRTGEMFTENELEARKQQEEREKYEKEFDRKEGERERRRRRDDGKGDKDESRYGDSDHRNGRRDRDRDRGKDDEKSDRQYHERKEKERQRRRERDDRDERNDDDDGYNRARRHRERKGKYSDDYDRESSRRHADRVDKDRHRERYRESARHG